MAFPFLGLQNMVVDFVLIGLTGPRGGNFASFPEYDLQSNQKSSWPNEFTNNIQNLNENKLKSSLIL